MKKEEIKDIIEGLENKVKEKIDSDDLNYGTNSLEFGKRKYNEKD